MTTPISNRSLLAQQVRAVVLPAVKAGVLSRQQAAQAIKAVEGDASEQAAQRQPIEAWDTPLALAFLHLKSPKTLRAWARQGVLHPIRLGKRAVRYNADEIRALLTTKPDSTSSTAAGKVPKPMAACTHPTPEVNCPKSDQL